MELGVRNVNRLKFPDVRGYALHQADWAGLVAGTIHDM